MTASPNIHMLGSYYFLKRMDLSAVLGSAPAPVDFFVDSGGFSASVNGGSVSIPDYADWLKTHHGVINAAATLDVIGDPVATETNTQRLQDLVGDAVRIIPAFHVGSPWPELERLTKKYNYVALGGAVAINDRTDPLVQWLAKAHVIARDNDCRLHGFGLTRPPYPQMFPWYSVDSSFWQACTRTGSLWLWDDETRKWSTMKVGTRKCMTHFSKLIRRYRGDPAVVSQQGYGVVKWRGIKAREEREWMVQAQLSSYRLNETYLRSRITVPAPEGFMGDGIKVLFAVGGLGHIKKIFDVVGAMCLSS